MTSYGRRCEVYWVWRQEFLDYCQNALNRISSWMTANLLTLNSSKTEILLIGVSKHLAKIHKSSLNTTHSARNLGFIFDKHLIFSDQISSVSKSCYYHNCQLCCIRLYLDSTTVDSPPKLLWHLLTSVLDMVTWLLPPGTTVKPFNLANSHANLFLANPNYTIPS